MAAAIATLKMPFIFPVSFEAQRACTSNARRQRAVALTLRHRCTLAGSERAPLRCRWVVLPGAERDAPMPLKSFSLAAALALLATFGLAQAQQQPRPESDQTARYGTPTVPRETQQPEGATGPLDTTSGGVTPASPQGDAPPGMQPMQHEPTGQGQSAEKKQPPLR